MPRSDRRTKRRAKRLQGIRTLRENKGRAASRGRHVSVRRATGQGKTRGARNQFTSNALPAQRVARSTCTLQITLRNSQSWQRLVGCVSQLRYSICPTVGSTRVGHDIIVIGASAGGVDALPRLIGSLPADLAATVFIVLHIPAQGPDLLSGIIGRQTRPPHDSAAERNNVSIEGR